MLRTGIKTTEFWLSLVAVLGGSLQSALIAGSPAERIAGMVVALLAALGYTGARVRSKTAEAAASVALGSLSAAPAGDDQVGGTA